MARTSTTAMRQSNSGAPSGPLTPKTFNEFLQKHKSQLTLALPKHLNADRMARLAMTAFSQNPKLAECEPKSIYGSIVLASQLGLEIGVGGQAYLVPYFDRKAKQFKAQFIPGWQGLVDLVNRTGRATVWTGAVFDGDEFDWCLGANPRCDHRPMGECDPSKITHAYAVGKIKGNDQPVIEVWTVERIKKHLAMLNKVGDAHYANRHFEMYCRKVVLLQVLKYMPKSIELQNVETASFAADAGKNVTIDGEFVTVQQDSVTDDREDSDAKDEDNGATESGSDAVDQQEANSKQGMGLE